MPFSVPGSDPFLAIRSQNVQEGALGTLKSLLGLSASLEPGFPHLENGDGGADPEMSSGSNS